MSVAILMVEYILFAVDLLQMLAPSLSFLNNKYTFPFLGIKSFLNSIAWSQTFCTSILSNSTFPNTFFYFQNLFSTSSSTSFFFSVFLTFFSFSSCFFFSHMGRHLIIFTFPFSQSISGLWAANYGISNITSVFPRLYISIFTLSMCPLKNILHSTWCVIALPTFTISFMFLTNREFFSLSSLNPFLFTNWVSMNNPVALLSSSALTTTLLWFSNFFSPIFIYTSLSGCSICRISLTSSVLFWQETLSSSFSGYNTLYLFKKASQKLTVFYCLLLTLIVFLLLFPLFSFFANNSWLYGPYFPYI